MIHERARALARANEPEAAIIDEIATWVSRDASLTLTTAGSIKRKYIALNGVIEDELARRGARVIAYQVLFDLRARGLIEHVVYEEEEGGPKHRRWIAK